MADTEMTVQTKFHSFLKQRNSKTSTSMQEAQRLVNLYRILNVFGSDFVNEYNEALKKTSDEVQTAMTALVGGPEVRQYLEFLQLEDQKHEEKDNPSSSQQQVGWLPSPAEDAQESAQNGALLESKWQHLLEEQDKKMMQMVNDLRREQNEALTRLMDQLSSSLQVQRQNTKPTAPKAPQPQYSEIIEEKNKENL